MGIIPQKKVKNGTVFLRHSEMILSWSEVKWRFYLKYGNQWGLILTTLLLCSSSADMMFYSKNDSQQKHINTRWGLFPRRKLNPGVPQLIYSVYIYFMIGRHVGINPHKQVDKRGTLVRVL